MKKIRRPLRRGQIWWVDFSPGRGAEQHGNRPALVVQTDEANAVDEYDIVIVAAITGGGHRDYPFHVAIRASSSNGLKSDGYVRCEQILTISKHRLNGYIGALELASMKKVDVALRLVLDL